MANFHPIDVRYKGPSTSYRGSPVAQPISVSGAIKTELPKVKRKARRPRARSNFTANLLTWVFKKWGGFIAALALYFVVTGLDPITLISLFSGL